MTRQPKQAAGPAAAEPAASPRVFSCPACAKQYRWSAQLEGKKIRCRACGHMFWPGGDPERTQTAAVARAGARSGFAMLAPSATKRVASETEELTALHNWVIPALVLAIGLGWRLYQVFEHAARFESVALWQSLLLVLAEWLLVTLALAGGLLAVTMFVDIEIDKIGATVLKLAATVILMCAMAQFCASFDRQPGDLYGMTLGVPCVLLLAFLMLTAMFRADVSEALMGSAPLMLAAGAVMAALSFTMQNELGTILSFGRPA